LAIQNKGANTTTNTGVNIIKSIKQINLHMINLTYDQSFYRIHPGIKAGQPKGLKIA